MLRVDPAGQPVGDVAGVAVRGDAAFETVSWRERGDGLALQLR